MVFNFLKIVSIETGKTSVFGSGDKDDAEKFLKNLLRNYRIHIVKSEVPEEEVRAGYVYTFNSKLILISAVKTDKDIKPFLQTS
jgi:hypothetical protein